jgi:hypothetical protein
VYYIMQTLHMVMFSAAWCPWSNKAIIRFRELIKNSDGINLGNNIVLHFEIIDCVDNKDKIDMIRAPTMADPAIVTVKAEYANSVPITLIGFPTFMIYDGLTHVPIEYNGSLCIDDIITFLNI